MDRNIIRNEHRFKWFFTNVSYLLLCSLALMLTMATVLWGVVLLPLGIGGKVNTELHLWPLWISLIYLFWSTFAAAFSWLFINIADDIYKDQNLDKFVRKVSKYFLKVSGFVLYPALLFWKGIIHITYFAFAKN